MELSTIITLGVLLITTITSLLGLRNKNSRDTITDLKYKFSELKGQCSYLENRIKELEKDKLDLLERFMGKNDNN